METNTDVTLSASETETVPYNNEPVSVPISMPDLNKIDEPVCSTVNEEVIENGDFVLQETPALQEAPVEKQKPENEAIEPTNDISLTTDVSLTADVSLTTDVTLTTNDVSLSTNDVTLSTSDVTLSTTNDVTLTTNDVTLSTNDVTLSTNDVTLSTNDVTLSTNDISLSTNDEDMPQLTAVLNELPEEKAESVKTCAPSNVQEIEMASSDVVTMLVDSIEAISNEVVSEENVTQPSISNALIEKDISELEANENFETTVTETMDTETSLQPKIDAAKETNLQSNTESQLVTTEAEDIIFGDSSDSIEIITTKALQVNPEKMVIESEEDTIVENVYTTSESSAPTDTVYIDASAYYTDSTTSDNEMKIKSEHSSDNTTYYIVEHDIIVEPKGSEDADTVEMVTVDKSEISTAEKDEQPRSKVRQNKRPLIPNHVLGRNVLNPNQEVLRNGRPPKPRIGVTVPHRNLTSQIVTKQDITEVLLERQKAKNSSQVYGANTLFAKKLTKTLASRIIPPKTDDMKNADLISILEGTEEVNTEPEEIIEEIEVRMPKKTNNPKKDESIQSYSNNEFVKQLEQQLALKQLNELEVETQRPSKRHLKLNKKPAAPPESSRSLRSVDNKASSPMKVRNEQKEREVTIAENKEAEPKFKANVPVKTYGRKWKSGESTSSSAALPLPPASVIESDMNENQTLYVTKKSSRIVKRKVIWDPDEVPVRLTVAKVIKIEKSPTKQIEKTPTKQIEKSSTKPIEKSSTKPIEKSSTKQIEKVPTKQIEKPSAKSPTLKQSPKQPEKLVEKSQIKAPEKVVIKQIEKGSLKSPIRVVQKVVEKTPSKQDKPIPKQQEKSLIISKSPIKKIIEKQVKVPTKEKIDRNVPVTKTIVEIKVTTPKKRLTEVDRLLMDEGAVNMLYSVKNEETPQKKRKQNVSDEKELRNKTNEILNDLQTSVNKSSAILLRKKESLPIIKKVVTPGAISRQKSKDSTRSSIQSPPASPVFHHPEASRIIRRHSSDSFSSEEESDQKRAEVRVTRSKVLSEEKQKQNEELSRKFSKLIGKEDKIRLIEEYDTIVVKYFDNFINIVLQESENDVILTVQHMKSICKVLSEAEDKDECKAILLTSAGNSFCQGIDYKTLISEKESARKSLAKEMATNVRNFLKCLAQHSKILICGLHGDVIGLGVMMLPLFDIVIANDSTTFSTPYAKLGSIPEGIAALRSPRLLQNVLVSELLYSSKKLVAAEAFSFGLVTRVLWPDKFEEELQSAVKFISKQSSNFMLSTKKFLKQDLEAALTEETELLINCWISEECQKNFANYS